MYVQYEDFLSPPTKDKHGQRSNGGVTAFAAAEDISRNLFSPLKSNAKNASEAVVTPDAEKMSVIKEVHPRTKYSNLPRELNFDTPITRSDFSPPPSCVNAIQLSNHIESAITFDNDSEMMSSQKSSDESLSGAELQMEEPVDAPSDDDIDNTLLNLNIVSKDVDADQSNAQLVPFQSEESTIDALPSSTMSLRAAGDDVEKPVPSDTGVSFGSIAHKAVDANVSDAQDSQSTINALPSSMSLRSSGAGVEKNNTTSTPFSWSMSTIDDQSSNSEESRLLVEINDSEKGDEDVNENVEASSDGTGKDSMALDSDIIEKKVGEDNVEDDEKKFNSSPKTTAKRSPKTRSKSSKTSTKTPKRLTPVVPSVRSTPESENTGEDFLSDYW